MILVIYDANIMQANKRQHDMGIRRHTSTQGRFCLVWSFGLTTNAAEAGATRIELVEDGELFAFEVSEVAKIEVCPIYAEDLRNLVQSHLRQSASHQNGGRTQRRNQTTARQTKRTTETPTGRRMGGNTDGKGTKGQTEKKKDRRKDGEETPTGRRT